MLRSFLFGLCVTLVMSCGRNPVEKGVEKNVIDASTDVMSPPGAPRGDVIQNGDSSRPSLSLDLDTEIELKLFRNDLSPELQNHIERQSHVDCERFCVNGSSCQVLRPEDCI